MLSVWLLFLVLSLYTYIRAMRQCVCVCLCVGCGPLYQLFLFTSPLVPPLKVDIFKVETRFVAGESSEIRCQTFGSRPAASISWWKDNVRLSDSSYKVSALCTQGCVSRSYVRYGVPGSVWDAVGLVSSPLWPPASRKGPTRCTSACDIGGGMASLFCLIHDRIGMKFTESTLVMLTFSGMYISVDRQRYYFL